MDLPSSSHFIYIPVVLALGLVFGFIWGAKITQENARLEVKRAEEVARKKAERRAQREAAAATGAPPETVASAPSPTSPPAGDKSAEPTRKS